MSMGMAPREVTQSTMVMALAARAGVVIAVRFWRAPVEVSAWTKATAFGFSRSMKAAASDSVNVSPQGLLLQTTLAPWRRPISTRRSAK